jgi:hypothetical protein
MARPTQQEIDEFNARMNEPEDTDSEDFEVVLFDENGNPVTTMPFGKAKAYFRKRGIDLDDDGSMSDLNAGTANGGNGTATGNSRNSTGGQPGAQGTANAGGAAQAAPASPGTRTSSKYFAGRNRATVQPAGTGIDTQYGDPAGNPPGR